MAEVTSARPSAGGRGLASAVLGCVAGAGLATFAATRVWAVAVTERPGLTDLRETTTGAAAQGWIVALALVALAGAGALLATRGGVRRGLGGLLVLVGVGLAVAAVTGRAGLDPGEAGTGSIVWPAACVAGSALIVLGGLSAARRGHHWPAMGSRYERTKSPSPHARPGEPTGPSHAAGPESDVTAPGSRVDTRAAWDALDRGDDPTT
nr:Trp biosynthesis-associated membrane protein [Actinoplanes sp. NBRC 103695]